MEQVLINESSLQDIANAIREKTEGTEPILPSEMGNVIRAIEIGGAVKTASGTGNVSAGITGLDFTPFAVVVATGTYPISHLYSYRFMADGNGTIIHATGQNVSYDAAMTSLMAKCSVYEGGFKCTAVSGSVAWRAVGV